MGWADVPCPFALEGWALQGFTREGAALKLFEQLLFGKAHLPIGTCGGRFTAFIGGGIRRGRNPIDSLNCGSDVFGDRSVELVRGVIGRAIRRSFRVWEVHLFRG